MTLIESWSPSRILQPAQSPDKAKQDALVFGASLTIRAGESIAIKTADKLGYPFASGGSDGTEVWKGFSMYDFQTDANGKAFLGANGITPSIRLSPFSTMPIWVSGIFDPAELSSLATPVAQVDTFTIGGTIEVGDIFKLTATGSALETAVVTYTATATTIASVTAGLAAAWNASNNQLHTPITATSTGTTVVLTADAAGTPFTVAGTTTESDGSASDSQTITRAATTANSGFSAAVVLAACPGARILHNGFILIP